ncbi:hypothetical protein GGH93_006327 [Coemansia aciculifera]|nr:hypothetical protein GGH93_006327 [Coemansia aciculifera]
MVKSVLLLGLALAATSAAAATASQNSFHGYHHNHGTKVKPFGPSVRGKAHHTVYETPVVVQAPAYGKRHLRASHLKPEDSELDGSVAVAAAYLGKQHGIAEESMRLKSVYRSEHNGVTHVYFRQVVNGLEVVNGNANVNIDRHGRVISSGNSFADKHSTPASAPPAHKPSGTVKDSWETAHHMASSAFDSLVNEVSEGLEVVKEAVGRLHIGDAVADFLGGGLVIDAVRMVVGHDEEAEVKGERLVRDKRGYKRAEYIGAKDAVQRLAHHIKNDLLPHQLASVQLAAATNLEGEPGLELTGLPRRFAVDGKVGVQAALVKLDDGSLVETWDLTVEQDDHWWNAQINARTGKIDSLVDWANQYADESYRVYPWQVPDPSVGERVLVKNPADAKASPQGWAHGNQTVGNNVYAQSNPDGGRGWEHNFRPTSANRVFDYALDLAKQPTSYLEAAITQLFYTNNFMHDLFFHYGFDEQAGNFQDENFSGKGKGRDAVIANAQDGSGFNNANFATPPDGRHPKMRMYVWDITRPFRDGDLEQGIVVHEYSHGISIRLTGGPANSNCLSYGEAGGMGEGWGDIFATIIRLTANHTRSSDIPMGEYSANRGIRKYPYSTNLHTNPSTYGILDGPAYWEVHAKGEVWAVVFYEVLWNLIDAHGFTPDLFSRDLTKGNTLALQLLVDGMKLQPCMPNFIDARDAILLADRQLTGGKNQCLIWSGFAKRGLGVGAELIFDSPWGGGSRNEDFAVPSECK